MRVAYIRRIKEQMPLSLEEIEVLKFTLMKAILHKNSDVIEPLMVRGVPILSVLENGKTPLRMAVETNNARIVEMLMIESMRTFQLYPPADISFCMDWVVSTRQFQLIDLTLYAIAQHPESQKKWQYFSAVCDYLSKLVDICKKEECQPLHFKEFEDLVRKKSFSKSEMQFFYYLWEKSLNNNYKDSIKFYEILAEVYYENDKKLVESMARKDKLIMTAIISFLGIILAAIGLDLLMRPLFGQILISLGVMIGLIGLYGFIVYKSFKNYIKREKFRSAHLKDRELLRACRRGDLILVGTLLRNGAHVNAIMGVAESTPLFEAIRFDNKPIINLLSQYNAYAGKGSQVTSFP